MEKLNNKKKSNVNISNTKKISYLSKREEKK